MRLIGDFMPKTILLFLTAIEETFDANILLNRNLPIYIA